MTPSPNDPRRSGFIRLARAAASRLRRLNPVGLIERQALRSNLALAAAEPDAAQFAFCLEALSQSCLAAGLPLQAPEAMRACLLNPKSSAHAIAQLAFCRHLLEAGAHPGDAGPGPAPIHLAIRRDGPAFLSLLIEFGADVDALDSHHQTPLIRAAGSLEPEKINILLQAGANPHAVDAKGFNAASAALSLRRSSLAPRFDFPSAEPNPQWDERALKIHCATLLLDAGSNPFDTPFPSLRPPCPILSAVGLRDAPLAWRLLELCPDPAAWAASLRPQPSPGQPEPYHSNAAFAQRVVECLPPSDSALLQSLIQRAPSLSERLAIDQALRPPSAARPSPRPAPRL